VFASPIDRKGPLTRQATNELAQADASGRKAGSSLQEVKEMLAYDASAKHPPLVVSSASLIAKVAPSDHSTDASAATRRSWDARPKRRRPFEHADRPHSATSRRSLRKHTTSHCVFTLGGNQHTSRIPVEIYPHHLSPRWRRAVHSVPWRAPLSIPVQSDMNASATPRELPWGNGTCGKRATESERDCLTPLTPIAPIPIHPFAV
jgi:hypothetical protein